MDKVVLLLERQALIKERDQLRAERDAAVGALQDIYVQASICDGDNAKLRHEWVRERCRETLAQLPTAAEAEYAALCRVASAAEALIAGIPTNEHGWYDPVNQAQERALTDALTELRRARGNGGSDG